MCFLERRVSPESLSLPRPDKNRGGSLVGPEYVEYYSFAVDKDRIISYFSKKIQISTFSLHFQTRAGAAVDGDSLASSND